MFHALFISLLIVSGSHISKVFLPAANYTEDTVATWMQDIRIVDINQIDLHARHWNCGYKPDRPTCKT